MNFAVVQRLFGLLLMLFSLIMLPPVIVSLIYQDQAASGFLMAALLNIVVGLILWLPVRRVKTDLRLRDGFLVVVLFWTILGVSGAVPLVLFSELELSFTDAVFESISGLTTTGATVITGLDSLPKSVLFYRQLLQWVGGMGIIVLAVAILPMLGIGGMQLYRAETPGPMKDTKLTPRIHETAKALWYIYLGLTLSCAFLYFVSGMDLFDAISHSFSTVAIGGFSTHDASIAYFNNPAVELVCVLFMLLSGVNFALHFMAVRSANVKTYWLDEEFRFYLLILFLTTAVAGMFLWQREIYGGFSESFRYGLFQVVSIGTTTGFTTTPFYAWPGFLPVLLIFLSFVGGCAGSTGGGIKVIRFLLLLKQGARELKRLLHPKAFINVKIGKQTLPERVIGAVWGFFAAYVAVFTLMLILLMMTGLDQVTAFSAVAACLNNLGPGLGDVGSHYAYINDFAKWILSFAMLLGRLEIFTLLVLFTPAFWRP